MIQVAVSSPAAGPHRGTADETDPMAIRVHVIDTPLGPLQGTTDEAGRWTTLTWSPAASPRPPCTPDDPMRQQLTAQISEYFSGQRTTFDLALAPRGSAFQKRVWRALREIPCGRTRSYGAIAAELATRDHARAVASAARANPLMILVPCHRAIGADGALRGYVGGIERKRRLLDLESRR